MPSGVDWRKPQNNPKIQAKKQEEVVEWRSWTMVQRVHSRCWRGSAAVAAANVVFLNKPNQWGHSFVCFLLSRWKPFTSHTLIRSNYQTNCISNQTTLPRTVAPYMILWDRVIWTFGLIWHIIRANKCQSLTKTSCLMKLIKMNTLVRSHSDFPLYRIETSIQDLYFN